MENAWRQANASTAYESTRLEKLVKKVERKKAKDKKP
jgi:hypothetical protein